MKNGVKSLFQRALLLSVFCTMSPIVGLAQMSPSQRADEMLARPSVAAEIGSEQTATATASLPWLELMFRGGWLMMPITLMSVIVVAIAVERTVALRRSRLLPNALANGLKESAECSSFDQRVARALCDQYPSALARVVQAMLMKVGRSSTEIEHAVSDACQREADRLVSNVRTLHLASTVTPLLGLLGTVQGMIQAFFVTANLAVGFDKGEALAEGIYVALVTTFAGLSVAIPASVLAHLFESRILTLLRDVEQIAANLVPQVESLQDQLRIDAGHAAPTETKRSTTPMRKSKAS